MLLRRINNAMFSKLTPVASLLLLTTSVQATQVNSILENLFTEQNVPGTVVSTTDDIANGSWSFSETNMNGITVDFNNNRHEFFFSEDGSNPILVDGDTPWSVEFDIRLDATLSSPRKAFNFVVFDGPNSFVNLTTNRSPAGSVGLSDPPGESAMFGGQYNFVRTIGPQDGDISINLNPTVGYTAGDTVRLEIHHTPSPDGGVTPSTVEHVYDDGTGPYTTGPRDLRNSGIFNDGARLGFILQGIAHSGTPTDSYGVTITNFNSTIGVVPGDYNGDGVTDAADYTVWRDNLGTAGPAGDGTGDDLLGVPDGDVDQFDYDYWAANFGAPNSPSAAITIPEPAAGLLTAIAAIAGMITRTRHQQGV